MQERLFISNSDMKKFLLYIVVFAIGLFVIDRLGGVLLDRQYAKSYNNENRAYRFANEDILILGSSRASHHYDPRIISDKMGLTCHNYGKDGQRIFYHYGILNLILSHHSPKIVIYDVNATDVEILSSESNFSGLSSFYPLYDSDDTIKNLIKLQGELTEVKVNLSHLYRHNSIFIDYFKKNESGGNGFSSVDGLWDEDISLMDEDKNPTHCELKHEYMERLIQICLERGVYLVLAVSPKYALSDRGGVTTKYLPLEQLAKDKGISFYYFEQDTTFIKHREYFKDILHLNRQGAELYSQMIATKLDEDYCRYLENNKTY